MESPLMNPLFLLHFPKSTSRSLLRESHSLCHIWSEGSLHMSTFTAGVTDGDMAEWVPQYYKKNKHTPQNCARCWVKWPYQDRKIKHLELVWCATKTNNGIYLVMKTVNVSTTSVFIRTISLQKKCYYLFVSCIYLEHQASIFFSDTNMLII